MMMVDMHSEKTVDNTTKAKIGLYNADVTTQMMMSGTGEHRQHVPPFKNHSRILVWTDDDDQDMFSLVLSRRLDYLREKQCPVLNECTFTFQKKGHEADTVVIASKRHFPYGGKESGKTWTLILPDPDYHRAWLRHGSKRQIDLKLLISYLPNSSFPMVRANFRKKKQRMSQVKRGQKGETGDNSELRLAATILNECETEGQREEYIKALQKHASVHIYGRCGAPCPGRVTEDCLKYLDKHYKVLYCSLGKSIHFFSARASSQVTCVC